MSLLAELHDKVRTILKAASEKKAAVPDDPGDPDELQPDYRVGDASPTEADAEEAKDDAEEGKEDAAPEGDHAEPDGDEDGDGKPDGDGDEPSADEGDGEEDEAAGRPMEKSFDEFDNMDLSDEEVREILKGYGEAPKHGVTPPVPTQDLLHEGEDLKAVLDDIMALIIHQQEKLDSYSSVMDGLRAEIARLKKGVKENERSITKALDVIGDPRTAPAAPPRAFNKAMPEPPAAPAQTLPQAELANKIFADLKAGKIDHASAMRMCRDAH